MKISAICVWLVASVTFRACGTSAATLNVLVTNDDGYDAKGLDALVGFLVQSPLTGGVTVVAPLENKSGSGSKTSADDLQPVQLETVSGFPVLAYDGFPADCVNWALNTAQLKPDVVVSGINEGMNEGYIACVSGTVGAARTAALAGIPAIAVSQEMGSTNFTAALDMVDAILHYVAAFLPTAAEATPAGDAPMLEVMSINVPKECAAPVTPCSPVIVKNSVSTAPETNSNLPEGVTNDVAALERGFITISNMKADFSQMKCPSI